MVVQGLQANMTRLGPQTQGFLLAENIWAFVRLSLNSYSYFYFLISCRGHGIIFGMRSQADLSGRGQ
jgi:hypothetical protein